MRVLYKLFTIYINWYDERINKKQDKVFKKWLKTDEAKKYRKFIATTTGEFNHSGDYAGSGLGSEKNE